MMSSMLAPASMFSKTVATGIRVPRKTHAPLTFPGTLSTATHCDQSSAITKPSRSSYIRIVQGRESRLHPDFGVFDFPKGRQVGFCKEFSDTGRRIFSRAYPHLNGGPGWT